MQSNVWYITQTTHEDIQNNVLCWKKSMHLAMHIPCWVYSTELISPCGAVELIVFFLDLGILSIELVTKKTKLISLLRFGLSTALIYEDEAIYETIRAIAMYAYGNPWISPCPLLTLDTELAPWGWRIDCWWFRGQKIVLSLWQSDIKFVSCDINHIRLHNRTGRFVVYTCSKCGFSPYLESQSEYEPNLKA